MSAAEIRKNLNNPALGIYIGKPGLPANSLFFLGGPNGNILISALSHDELILRGVFQINRSDCFLSPDGAFQPTNQFESKFEDVKLSCKLTVPHHDDFKFLSQDSDVICKNIKGFEALIQKGKDDTSISSMQATGGWVRIKMVHPLFLKHKESEGNTPSDSAEISDETNDADLSVELGDDFSIKNWPVSTRCQPLLDKLVSAGTHSINPLPVYDIDHTPVPPRKYKDKLPGAIVLASLAFTHFHVKSNQRHIFNTVCRELLILRDADDLPSSPYKKRRFGRGPLMDNEDDIAPVTASSSQSMPC
ncbi:hypothetical protein L210DRAFT_962336 [Boletus edulis BED1]|uniref:Uncharacterized protein n=1 Tax=Boletus edulis BED1 TaxID=1328754 RepID=A0AAD4G8D0_BOLED|nr:hypothetical protein L210DRAFT_962336 [Boletus edulis BED1]